MSKSFRFWVRCHTSALLCGVLIVNPVWAGRGLRSLLSRQQSNSACCCPPVVADPCCAVRTEQACCGVVEAAPTQDCCGQAQIDGSAAAPMSQASDEASS